MVEEIRSISSGIPASILRLLSSIAEAGPKRLEVLPVTI